MGALIGALCGAVGLGLIWLALSARVIKQYERGLVFRFGRVKERVRGPGLTLITPIADRLHKVNMQIVTLPVPAQDGITRDNVTVKVDAVVYFKVLDPFLAIVNVQTYLYAVSQVAQTSLRSMIGKSELDDLLSNRERLNQGLEIMIDSPAVGWGIHIDRVEIKDVALPESMKRSIARQAEAERERRARIITADGELAASHKLSQAAARMADTPTALQLRLLQTVVEVAAEKNSTVIFPFPVELLRFLERANPAVAGTEATGTQLAARSQDDVPAEVATQAEVSSEPAEAPAADVPPTDVPAPADVAAPHEVPAADGMPAAEAPALSEIEATVSRLIGDPAVRR